MLDQSKAEEPEVTEAEAPEPEAELPEETGEIVVQIEGEEAEPDEDAEIEAELGDKGKHALKAAREAAKQARAEARELKAKLAEREAQAAPPAPELKRPSMEDCGFNEDVFAEKMASYVAAKKDADAAKAAEEAETKAREDAYQAKLARYNSERGKVGVDDDAQAKVVAALNAQQQAALMDASADPAKVVAALAKTPKVLAELAGIKAIHQFTYRLAQIEGKITVTQKEPPPPESKLRGGVAASGGNWKAMMDAAEKRAEISGDRTEIAQLRRRMREAGVSA